MDSPSSSSSAPSSVSSSSSSSMSSTAYRSDKPSANVVIRCGHIIPSIRLTPPDTRPEKSIELPEQDLDSTKLFVPLRTEEIGWEEGGLIWAAKRYCYPVVNLYGGDDDHVIGTYRGGPKGYRYINITDKAFALSSHDDDDISEKPSKTSKDGRKSSMPKGPATKMQASSSVESSASAGAEDKVMAAATPSELEADTTATESGSSVPSTPSSSRRGSSSTEDSTSSGRDTGATTPADEESDAACIAKGSAFDEELATKLGAALAEAKQQQKEDLRTTRLASRTGSKEISSDSVDASRLSGPIKSHLQRSPLGLDRSMTLSDTVPSVHFQPARGRSSSRRPANPDYHAGWSYEDNMKAEFSQ